MRLAYRTPGADATAHTAKWTVRESLYASHTRVQGEEVDVEEEDGVEEQWLFMLQLLDTQQGPRTEGRPHHTQQLKPEQHAMLSHLWRCMGKPD